VTLTQQHRCNVVYVLTPLLRDTIVASGQTTTTVETGQVLRASGCISKVGIYS